MRDRSCLREFELLALPAEGRFSDGCSKSRRERKITPAECVVDFVGTRRVWCLIKCAVLEDDVWKGPWKLGQGNSGKSWSNGPQTPHVFCVAGPQTP
jgi:hypothetical protein